MARLFGTDGVRGIAGKDLSNSLAYNIGKAVAFLIKQKGVKNPSVLIAKDTRISGDMLESAISIGLTEQGADVVSLSVLPTPAVSYLVKEFNADAGIMISASHNPYEYNGIKIFGSDGLKLSDQMEDCIEAIVKKDDLSIDNDVVLKKGTISTCPKACELYSNYIKSCITIPPSNIKLLVDCANGSACATAEKIFSHHFPNASFINNSPNGKNINLDSGCLHIELLRDKIKAENFDLAIAFDGDADRLIVMDKLGNEIDGDYIMAILAKSLKDANALNNNTLVLTVMSNLGLINFAKDNGISVVKTSVGDRYVLEEMIKNNYSLGGEQSGHIIVLDKLSTGDGELTAALFLNVVLQNNYPLDSLSSTFEKFPQLIVNLDANPHQKQTFLSSETLKAKIEQINHDLGDNGRLLVRPSGTEMFIRVMGEHSDKATLQKLVDDLCALITDEIYS